VDLRGQGSGRAKALQEVNLLLLGDLREAEVGASVLRERLRELAQLDDCRGGVIGEVPLRQRPQRHEQGVVGRQEAEVRRKGGPGHRRAS
jgi:hypothetical protein